MITFIDNWGRIKIWSVCANDEKKNCHSFKKEKKKSLKLKSKNSILKQFIV